jgi:hypothetical protein
MSFERIMAEVVGRAITEEQELSGPWNEYKRTGDRKVLQEACGYGQKIPDTRLGAYYYSLVYQKQHYDVLAAVMALQGAALPHQGRCLMVDFGAGPGTAALAWAAHVAGRTGTAPALSYVHLDRLPEMEPLCDALLQADPNTGSGFRGWSYREVPKDAACPRQWVEDADHAVFVFSYVLCQATVGTVVVDEFARLITETCKALNGKPAYLLMVDAPLSNSCWPPLLGRLRQKGMTATPTHPAPTLQYRAVYLNPDGTVRDFRDNAGPAIYDMVQLQ